MSGNCYTFADPNNIIFLFTLKLLVYYVLHSINI